MKTLNDRVIEAKTLASLSKIVSRDKAGRVSVVLVPCSEATRNQVIIRRHNGSIISCECRKEAGAHGYVTCNGNLSGVCRHSIAAIIVALGDAGYTPRFRKSLEAAQKLAKAKAKLALTNSDTGAPVIFTLKSKEHGKNMIYFVAIDAMVKELSQPNLPVLAEVMPEEIAVEIGQREIERELSLAGFALQAAGFATTDDDGYPGHPSNYGDFNGVR